MKILLIIMAITANLITVVAINMLNQGLESKTAKSVQSFGVVTSIVVVVLLAVLVFGWSYISQMPASGKMWAGILFIAVSIVATQLLLAFSKNIGVELPIAIAFVVAFVLLGATCCDMFGWPNVAKRTIEWQEIVGVLIVLVGVGLAAKGQMVASARNKAKVEQGPTTSQE